MLVVSSSASYSFTPEEKLFFDAAKTGDLDAVEFYVSGGLVDINATDENNQTGLDIALLQKQYKVATLLRKLGGVGTRGLVKKKFKESWKAADTLHNLALVGIIAVAGGALAVSCYALTEQTKLLMLLVQCQHNELLLQQGVNQLSARLGVVESKVLPVQKAETGQKGPLWLGLLKGGIRVVTGVASLIPTLTYLKQSHTQSVVPKADNGVWETVKSGSEKVVGGFLNGVASISKKVGAYAAYAGFKKLCGF